MLRLTKSSFIDAARYLKDLEKLKFVYIEPKTLKVRLDNFDNEVNTLYYLCSMVLKNETGGGLNSPEKNQIIVYLTEYLNCPRYLVLDKKSNAPSLNATKVIAPLIEKGYGVEFLTLYREHSSKKKLLGDLKGYLDRMSDSDCVDIHGNKLTKLYFSYEPKVNLRVNTRDSNIQGMSKKFCDCMHAPKGYTIVSGDFAQSDIKIAYNLMLKSEENYNVMLTYDDTYEAFARVLLGEEFDLDEFKEHRSEYKLNSLAPIYGAKKGNSTFANNFIEKANKYLSTCERYQENLRRINRRIDLGFPLKVTSYFGNTELVHVEKRGNKFIGSNPITFSLNSPIQTGTSEVLKAVTNSIMDGFAELGFNSENGAIYSYLNRHDEALFLIRNDLLEHSYIFQKNQVVLVDDWTPLTIEFSYQTEYTVENEELDKKAKAYYRKEYEEVPRVSLSSENYYIPCKDILSLNIGTFYCEDLNSTVIAYHDYYTEKCSFEALGGADENEIMSSIEFRLSNCRETLDSTDSDSVHAMYNKVIGKRDFFNGYLIRVEGNAPQHNVIQSSILAEYGAYLISKSKGITMNISDLLRNSMAYAEEVVKNGEVFL